MLRTCSKIDIDHFAQLSEVIVKVHADMLWQLNCIDIQKGSFLKNAGTLNKLQFC